MERIYTLKDACDILQIDPATLRKWDREGKIKCIRMQNNFRRIPESEINRILRIQKKRSPYIYARVSSSDRKNDLERQVERLEQFSPESRIIPDIRSGMKFERKGFVSLLNLIEKDEVYVTHKDRLARSGLDPAGRIFRIHGTGTVEIDGEEILLANQELTNDLISIITSFSARLYGLRSNKMKKILEA